MKCIYFCDSTRSRQHHVIVTDHLYYSFQATQIRVHNWKLYISFLNKNISWGTQKNVFNETALLSTQNVFKLLDSFKEKRAILPSKFA